jgi:hypothetical protein
LGIGPGQTAHYESTRHPAYAILQCSGLIYGFPAQYPFRPAPEVKMKGKNKAKMILLDLILYSALVRKSGDETAYEEKVEETARLISSYYQGVHDIASQGEEPSIENILLDRVAYRKNYFDFRRSGINSHLFWDWYFFQEYLEAVERNYSLSPEWFDNLLWRKKEMKKLTIMLVAAAIHSDRKITRGEQALLNHFHKSARFLSANEKARIKKILDEGIDLERIRLPELSWIGRRYLLDISLLAIYADKKLEKAEEKYLIKLTRFLNLSEDDLLESKVDLGLFLFQYGRKLHFYNRRKNGLALVGQAVSENTGKLGKAATLEYEETMEMASTFGLLLQHQFRIGKHRRVPSEEEIAFALDQLKDIPRFLPFFSIMFVPVPGITEAYILLACAIERLTGDSVRLLPSQFSRFAKGK